MALRTPETARSARGPEWVALTGEGRAVAYRAADYLAEMMGKLLGDLEAGEREGLAHAFERVFELSVRIQEEQRRMVALA